MTGGEGAVFTEYSHQNLSGCPWTSGTTPLQGRPEGFPGKYQVRKDF